jgi:hypothetical protein
LPRSVNKKTSKKVCACHTWLKEEQSQASVMFKIEVRNSSIGDAAPLSAQPVASDPVMLTQSSATGASSSGALAGSAQQLQRFEAYMQQMRAELMPQSSPIWSTSANLGEMMGMDRLMKMGKTLSQADRASFQSVEKLMALDPTDPALPAEMLGVSLNAAKSSISSTLAMKFSSKVSEGLNTLLKNS